MKYINLPAVLQFVGAVVFGVTVWKGVHGPWVTAGLLGGAGAAYLGKSFSVYFK